MKLILNLLLLPLTIANWIFSSKDEDEKEPEPVLWKPEMITAEIRADNVHLKVGKYLYLEQILETGEYGWSKSLIDIPDSWVVLETYFNNEQLVLEVKGFGKYQVNSVNKGPLSYAVLSAGKGKKVDNAKLEEIWEAYAKVQNG